MFFVKRQYTVWCYTQRMKKVLQAATIVGVLAVASVASANHSWGGYHWARTQNPFTLKLGDNVNASWDSYLTRTAQMWSVDPTVLYPGQGVVKVINPIVVAGATSPKNCKPVPGTVQVCNSSYGNNGWLGIAQVWISGSHITQGTAKMNDTYFNSAKYNTPAWRRLVMCQEVAHTVGLDHQDETFNNFNLGTCMDYTNAPSGGVVAGFDYGPSNESPNFHDYQELALIYAHLDTTNSFSTATVNNRGGVAQTVQEGDFDNASQWGKAIAKDVQGRDNTFKRDFGDGSTLVTHIYWAY